MKLLLLSDGKAGHLTSSKGIAQCLPKAEVDELRVQFRSKWRDNRLRLIVLLTSWISPSDALMERWLQSALMPESYASLSAYHEVDAILSTGSSVAPVNLCWSRILGVPSIVCRRPSPLGIRALDMVILPRYQWPHRSQPNVIYTLGVPNQIQPARLTEYRPRDQALPCVGIFIGGEDPYFTMSPETAEAWAKSLIEAVESLGIAFALTTSRRTSPAVEERLIEQLAHHPQCLLFAPVHTDPRSLDAPSIPMKIESPVLSIMGMSDVLMVTEDSYSMACEALSSSRPVILLQMNVKKHAWISRHPKLPKRQQDYELMAEEHRLTYADPQNLRLQLENALAQGWPQPALRDAEHAAEEILLRLRNRSDELGMKREA